MDPYTLKAKEVRERGFSQTSAEGIYIANQPIYGLRSKHSARSRLYRYVITYNYLLALTKLKFHTLIDIGGGEGYKAFLVEKFLKKEVLSSDLSEEACKRAKEIFNVDGSDADIHDLPFGDSSYDIATSSETLEHVSDPEKALRELLRIARCAVVITVPTEPEESVYDKDSITDTNPHIQSFEIGCFDYLKSEGYSLWYEPYMCKPLRIPAVLIDAEQRPHRKTDKFPKLLSHLYNLLVPILKLLFGEGAASFLVAIDKHFCKLIPYTDGMVVTIIKDQKCVLETPFASVSPSELVKFSVPHHYLEEK